MGAEIFNGYKTDEPKFFNEYQKNKLKYLNEAHKVRRTQEVYWGVFQRFVLFHEINKEKDLYEFNKEEVEEILKSIPSSSVRTRRAAWTAIDQYLNWAYEREWNLTGNVCSTIDINEILDVSKKMLSKKYYDLKDIYDICKKAEIQGNPYQEIAALLLARYGVVGKKSEWLINLKWLNIDKESLEINITNEDGEIISTLPIDEQLLGWLEKAKNETGYEVKSKGEGIRHIQYFDTGYILKPSRQYADTVDNMVIYGYLARISANVGIKKISLNDLLKSRKFDLLNKIKEEQGFLTVDDFKHISKLFNPEGSYSTYSTLLKDYKLLTGEEIKK